VGRGVPHLRAAAPPPPIGHLNRNGDPSIEGLFKKGCSLGHGPTLQEEVPLSVEMERNVLLPHFDPEAFDVLKVSTVQSIGDSEDRG